MQKEILGNRFSTHILSFNIVSKTISLKKNFLPIPGFEPAAALRKISCTGIASGRRLARLKNMQVHDSAPSVHQ